MVYVILPLQKEGDGIPCIVDNLKASISQDEFKIIIVNDGGHDDVPGQLTAVSAEKAVVISQKMSMGMGAVLSAGILTSLELSRDDSDVVIAMDNSCVNEQSLFKRFVLGIKDGNDVVIASRYRQGGGYINFPFLRKIYSRMVNRLMRLIFPIERVRDYTIFLRAYKIGLLREAVRYYGKYGLVQARGFTSSTELLVKLSFLTKRIIEVPFFYDLSRNETRNKINFSGTINEYIVIINYLNRIAKKLEVFRRCPAKQLDCLTIDA